MALDSIERRVVYEGDGSQKDFPFSFVVFKDSDITVSRSIDENRDETVATTEYSVELSDDGTGTVHFVEAPAEGIRIAILSAVPETQPMKLTTYDGFDPEVLNDSADRIVALIQQLSEKLSRALLFPATSETDAEQLVSDLLAAGEAARKVIPYLEDIENVASIADAVETISGSIQQIIAIADNLEDLLRIEDIIDEIQQIENNVALAQAAAEAAEAAAAEIESKLADVEGVFEENKVLIQLTDTYLLTVLNTAATASWNFTARDIEAYWKWYQDGLDKLQQVATIALHSAEATENDIEHFVAYMTKAEEDETRLLKLLSQTAERSRQLVEMHISTYDDDIRTRNILIRTYVEKPVVLFIVAGQSNAVGYARPPYESADYCGQLWNWTSGVNSLKPLKDPTNAWYPNYASAWPAFARSFFELTGRKVALLNVARGGSAVTNHGTNTWYGEDVSNSLRVNASTQYAAMTSALGTADTDYVLGGLLWIQGEAECAGVGNGTITTAEYKTGTLDVFRFFRKLTSETELPVFMSQIGYTSSVKTNAVLLAGYHAIQAAQTELAHDTEGVHMAFEGAKYFLDAGEMTDSIHYSQKGYNIVGDAFARCTANTLIF